MFTKLCLEKSLVGGILRNIGNTPNTPQKDTGWASAFKPISYLEGFLPGLRESRVDICQTYLLSIRELEIISCTEIDTSPLLLVILFEAKPLAFRRNPFVRIYTLQRHWANMSD